MSSPLEDLIARKIGDGFRDKLITGVLRREHSVETEVDNHGDPIPPTEPELFTVHGIRDNFRASYMAFNDIPMTDVRILLIMRLIRPLTTPLKDDQIYIMGQWHKVRRVLELDPALAAIVLQSFTITAPTPATASEAIRWASEFYLT